MNERGERVRMRGKGRITDKTIKLLTRYYGKAIRSSDCAAMQDAVWAVFYHSQSTDSSPQHQYCSSGQRSTAPVCPSGQRSTAPVLPQWSAVHSTSIAPVASGPQHQYCPSGQRSWCKFNRALANSEPSPPHSPTIHPDIDPPLKKVFERLSPTLMESCVLGATQNLNESFNSTIWQRCPKTESSALQPWWRLLSI